MSRPKRYSTGVKGEDRWLIPCTTWSSIIAGHSSGGPRAWRPSISGTTGPKEHHSVGLRESHYWALMLTCWPCCLRTLCLLSSLGGPIQPKKKKKTQLFSRTYRNEPHFIFSSCLSNLFTLPLVYWSLYFLSQARLALPTPVYMTCLLYPHLICFILFLSVFVFLYLTIPFPSMSFLTPQCFSWYWREGVIYKQCSGGPGPYWQFQPANRAIRLAGGCSTPTELESTRVT